MDAIFDVYTPTNSERFSGLGTPTGVVMNEEGIYVSKYAPWTEPSSDAYTEPGLDCTTYDSVLDVEGQNLSVVVEPLCMPMSMSPPSKVGENLASGHMTTSGHMTNDIYELMDEQPYVNRPTENPPLNRLVTPVLPESDLEPSYINRNHRATIFKKPGDTPEQIYENIVSSKGTGLGHSVEHPGTKIPADRYSIHDNHAKSEYDEVHCYENIVSSNRLGLANHLDNTDYSNYDDDEILYANKDDDEDADGIYANKDEL